MMAQVLDNSYARHFHRESAMRFVARIPMRDRINGERRKPLLGLVVAATFSAACWTVVAAALLT